MFGKSDFPEILPSPPSGAAEGLLGPTDFTMAPESSGRRENTSTYIVPDRNSDNFFYNSNDDNSQPTVDTVEQSWLYKSKATSAECKWSFKRNDSIDYARNSYVKSNDRLYPEIEVMDGKEIVTLTTSNTAPGSCVISNAPQKILSVPTNVGSCSNWNATKQGQGNDADLANEMCNFSNGPSKEGNPLLPLLTPESFKSPSPCLSQQIYSGHYMNSAIPLKKDMDEKLEDEKESTLLNVNEDSYCTSQALQINCNGLTYREEESSQADILTPEQFTRPLYQTQTSNDLSNFGSYCGNGVDTDLMSSDVEYELEQELAALEQGEDDDDSKEDQDGQTQNKSWGAYNNDRLPPIGVFWDIENCQVPKGLSATHVVQAVRSRFFTGYREAEFMCVCDTLKENSKILEELNDAQVNVVHVGSTVKNAADDKLLQSMRRFADIHGTGATLVLISGDSNFATELYDLRYRKNLRVILVHNAHAQDSLKLCAHQTALFTDVTQELPQRVTKPRSTNLRREIIIKNVPENMDDNAIRRRLTMLSANCGGKVGRVRPHGVPIYFQTPELAARAKKRLDGEDVYGSKIYCTFGKNFDKEGSPKVDSVKHFQRDRGQEALDTWKPVNSQIFPNPSQPGMGDTGTASLSWRVRDPVNDSALQPYTAFKSYGKNPAMSFADQHFGSCQRAFRNNNCRIQSQSSVSGSNSHFGGLSRIDCNSHNDGNSRDIVQPLYLDKTPEQFKKGRSQRIQFRMSSPPSFSFNTRTPDSYTLDSSLRARSPSPLLWSGMSPVKPVWSPSPTVDAQGQILYGLKELSLGEGTVIDTSLASVQQVPVELQVTNLDQNIDAREMKRILFTIFRDHVMVLHVSVFVQSDGNLAATLRVPSQQDAQYAISQLHRKKIGAKRIIISYVNQNQPSPELKRSKVIALLQEVPGKKLPLFKFRELYERRFHETIGVSEMYNMRDIVTVSDNSTGRMVSLHPEFRHMSSPILTESAQEEVSGSISSRYCKMHSTGPDDSIGWAERDQSSSLPNVNLALRTLAGSIHSLLQSHSGSLPLASLVDCYEAEIGPVEEAEDGVPLEHLVSCLPGVCIMTATGGFKYVQWVENKVTDEAEELARCVSPPLVGQLALFSRELVDLLKTFPFCRLPFSRFIPAYHHHFGRQCRVADYGFTKLADLFEALPHVVQVLGEGNKRILTLAHKAQVKRFSSDLLRVLKGQPTKAITLEAFPVAYEKALTRTWNVIDYGVCDVEDLLTEVSETTVIVTRSGTETTIAIPKREQTPEEIERTRQFAAEVVELLRHSPQCKMQFNRFIPAYHHHFGRQCRVADYGFSKLIELFEAIPDVLQVYDDEDDGEKQLQLVERERVRVLGDQVGAVVRGAPRQAIRISALTQVFTRYYGYSLKPTHYGANTLEELIGKLRNHVKLVETGDEPVVALVDRGYVHEILVRARKLLWEDSSCSYPLDKFVQTYTERYGHPPSLDVIKRDLEDVLVIDGDGEGEGEEAKISLVPLQMFARDLLTLLHEAGGRMLLLNFDTAYLDRFGVACRPATYGFPNIVALVQALGDLVAVRGRGTKRILVLNRDSAPSPPSFHIPTSNSSSFYGDNPEGATGDAKPPPPSHLPPPSKVTPPQQCDYQRYMQANSNGHLMMGMNAPTPHPTYQPSSPVVYPGSPAPTGGSVMWGQMWSPQYPVMPPLSPAHYMVPTLPMSWGSMPASPAAPLGSSTPPAPLLGTMAPPISIHMLDELSKQAGKLNEEYAAPPSASELPPPELFTQMHPQEQMAAQVSPPDNCNQASTSVICEEADDTWSSCNSDADKGEVNTTSTPMAPKLRTKRRLAAQFAAN
ncbi:meiosis regulator and mRNA stability factor 1-like isoform X3 [Penaeus japonicus]|uniref:meiosis regulator and mRNA stability factor 1-like isoform X3 n=1 Tax=Penaeus japonicus TaxID=27405 RepID=UPI001C7144EA|nr:meiosis regulator and mRNA stability factor 1-like isoform X3 [Penaeus japonicus]